MSTALALAAFELREKLGGVWAEHPDHAVSDWQYEVENGDTRSGYWEWCVAQIEQAEDDDESEDETTSSLLEICFRLGPVGQPYSNMADLVDEMDYQLSHDVIEGTEIIETDAETGRIKVAVRLHHQVNETSAQAIGSDLDYQFKAPDSQSEYEAEMVSVDFPAWM